MQVFAATRRKMLGAVELGIKAGVDEMHRLVPKDSGDLDSTIEGATDGKGNGKISAGNKTGKTGRFVDYQNIVEEGATHQTAEGAYHTPAQPYFRPGIERAKSVLKNNLKVVEK